MNKQLYCGAVSVIALLSATAAFAQQAPEPEGSVAEVVVTGSRIARRDFVSTSPVVTQSVEALRETGKVSVEASLNQLPQFLPAQNERTQQQSGGGRASVSLRGLGQTRNLVLLDGRRLPASDAFGVVDVNIIPPAILQGIETITGGASAVYGSDAISGVVNFKTLSTFSGLRVDAQYGDTEMGGGSTRELSVTVGDRFANDKGNAIVSIGYSDRDEIFGWKRAPWYLGQPNAAPGSTFIPMGAYVPGANQPSQAAVNAVFAQYGVAAGAVGRTADFGFNDDGTLFSRAQGVNYKGPGYPSMNRSGGAVTQGGNYRTTAVPQTRYSLYSKANYEFSPNLRVYAQAIYVNSRVINNNEYNVTAVQTPPPVPVTNPFVPRDLRTLLASRADPLAPWTLSQKRFTSLPMREWYENFDVRQILVGAGGELGFKDWAWDFYASKDRTYLTETAKGVVVYSNLMNLLNAPDGGNSICAGGFNPFGEANSNKISKACFDYLVTQAHNTYDVRQDVFEGSLNGTLFALPADDVKFSLTAAARRNSSVYSADNLYVTNNALNSPQTKSSAGSTSVREIAGELLVPVLKDMPLATSLNLNLGYRYSKYRASGGVSTYKAEADWKPVASLLIRGGYERAIRAPNIGELYLSPIAAQINLNRVPTQGDPCDIRASTRTDPTTAAKVRTLCLATGTPASVIDSYTLDAVASVLATTSGNTSLTPERGTTKTIGAVWRPRFDNPFISGLSLSVDYYDIQIDNIINTIAGADIVTKCFNRDGSNPTYSPTNAFCRYIHRAPDGTFASIDTPYLNLGKLSTTGVDVNFDYSLALSAFGLSENWGRLLVSTVWNNTRTYKTQALPNALVQDFAGTINGGAPPEYRALTTFTYRVGPADIGLRWQWIPKLKDRTTVTTPATPLPPTAAYNLFDLIGGYKVTETLGLRAGVTNLFNRKPNNVGGQVGSTSPLFDIIGRAYYLQATAKF